MDMNYNLCISCTPCQHNAPREGKHFIAFFCCLYPINQILLAWLFKKSSMASIIGSLKSSSSYAALKNMINYIYSANYPLNHIE